MTPRSCVLVRRSHENLKFRVGDLDGIYQAMEFLPLANRVQEGDLTESPYDVAGKHVVILGGG